MEIRETGVGYGHSHPAVPPRPPSCTPGAGGRKTTFPRYPLQWGRLNANCVCVLVAQSCLTLCNPMEYSPPGSSVHGTLQARILEWVAIPFSRGSSWPRDQTQVSHISGWFFTIWATREALNTNEVLPNRFTCMSLEGQTWGRGALAT